MNAKQRESLMLLRDALKPFADMDGTMTVNRITSLLAVYIEGIADMIDLREHMEAEYGLSRSALSRQVSWWGDEAYLQFKNDAQGNAIVPVRPEGQQFLAFKPDPRDYRRRTITITPKGEQFAQALADKITADSEEHVAKWQAK